MTSSINAKKKVLWRISPLPFAIALALSVAPVWAQDEDAVEDAVEEVTETAGEKAADLGRIQVTGSLIKRQDFTSTSPVQIINAETMAQVGQLEIADILQGNTIAAGSTQLNNQFAGFVVQGGTGVQTLDLRGLGSSRTLVLLNGGRVGGSGTRGQVNSLDLATIPDIAVQRVELVLDGSSSIYGSDAIAGVANIITRRQVDGFEFNALTELPEAGGGELVRAALITGWNSDKGSATLSAQWQYREALTVGDRDFLSCSEPLFRDAAGNSIDREDRSITAGTAISGCQDLYHNTILDLFTGARYIPSPDGVTIGPFPGYRPRQNGRYDDAGGEAFYEDVLTETYTQSASALNQMERFNVYATFDYAFDFWGGVDWSADVLYSNRKTETIGWRQFFPAISSSAFIPYDDDPSYNPGLTLSLPVMPYPSNSAIDVDFFYVKTGLQGVLPTDSYWSWQVNASYSRSDGEYTRNSILASRSSDIFAGGTNAPLVDFFDPGFLNGERMDELVRAIGVNQTGNTVYTEFTTNAIITGDLFELPAGTVGIAGGVEYRTFSIDDQPSQESREGNLWGESSALVTKGTNTVKEAFVELEVPLLAGIPGIEELTLNVSARTFDYDFGGGDTVWKAGLGWRVVPSVLARATIGTSYRAPALFELFLGDQTAFAGQLGIDPCITWGDSVNDNVRANCAAEGIPDDYAGGGASATVISGGGAANLSSETSDAITFGLVWTPEFTDLSIAVDYIDITVNDQIAQLSAASIVSGCYSGENFPNSFCDLLTRAPGNDPLFPFNITEVNDSFVNVNEQRYKGIDLNVVWNKDLDFGQLEVAIQSTWNLENNRQLFAPGSVEGFDTEDSVGTIGSPENVTNFRTSFNWEDWRFNYLVQYIGETDESPFVDAETTYFGFDPAFRDITLEDAFYHTVSVIYQQADWDVLFGVNNLFNEEPDTISAGVATRRGNIALNATQYDILGRRYFVRFNYRWQ
ncbi:MAG: TonB-dependent receptor [Xanthomonadales bacterium]|nr:TonB-dependent receptor [Xanthomonadales bacterium]